MPVAWITHAYDIDVVELNANDHSYLHEAHAIYQLYGYTSLFYIGKETIKMTPHIINLVPRQIYLCKYILSEGHRNIILTFCEEKKFYLD